MLKLFLTHPDEEFFVREITRMLEEQINAVRRELINFKKIGLVTYRSKDKRKYFMVNKNFLLFPELRSMVLKTQDLKEDMVGYLTSLGEVDCIIMTGMFVQTDAPVDLLIVGSIQKDILEEYLMAASKEKPIRYAVFETDNFLYRIEYKDKFIMDLLKDPKAKIVHNQLHDVLSQVKAQDSSRTTHAPVVPPLAPEEAPEPVVKPPFYVIQDPNSQNPKAD